MAEFLFFGTASDTEAVAEVILEGGGYSLIPSASYQSPRAVELKAIDSGYREAIARNRRMKIKGSFTGPLRWVQLASGSQAGKFEIDAYADGPLIILDMPVMTTSSNETTFVAGCLELPRKYWSTSERKYLPPSCEVRLAYADLRKRIASTLTSLDVGRKVRVGTEARSLFKSDPSIRFRVDGKLLP